MSESGVLIQMKKQLLIAGGSGMIGSALSEEAHREGWEVTILSRSSGPGRIIWNPSKGEINILEKQYFDAVINVAGSPVTEKRWTKKKKHEIYQSRIGAAQTLEKYFQNGLITTPFYLGASAIGIYGDRWEEVVHEKTVINHQDDWFVKTVIDWETAHNKIDVLGIRTVILRIGIVLSMKGGALKEIISTPGFAVLAYFGDGHQIYPWIHISDLTRIIMFCINRPSMTGIYIAASPNPVSNKVLTKTINTYISPKRIVAGVPKLIMSIILGEMHRVLFESCNASSAKIQQEGFLFSFYKIDDAMKNLLVSSE
jgi:uncharacterized protein (TIGR01777 family)